MGLPQSGAPSSGSAPLPGNSTLVTQAPLVAANGATVSGSAAVYSEGNGTYIVQLQSLSASFPSTPETVDAEINGLYVSGSTLTSTTGTANYTFTSSEGANFEAVYIHCTTCSLGSPSADYYASATF